MTNNVGLDGTKFLSLSSVYNFALSQAFPISLKVPVSQTQIAAVGQVL